MAELGKSTIDPVTTTIETVKDDAPIDLYESRWGRPYITDLLDMSGVDGDYQEDLKAINNHLLSEIRDRGLSLTKESYQMLVADMENKLNLDPTANYETKIEKIKAYVMVLLKQKKIELTKKLMEYGPAR